MWLWRVTSNRRERAWLSLVPLRPPIAPVCDPPARQLRLITIARFPAPDPQALYEGVQAITWEEQLVATARLVVPFSSARSAIVHTQSGALKVKDAIADHFRERLGTRPCIDLCNRTCA